MDEICKIVMKDDFGNIQYIREIIFKGNKEVVIMPASFNEDIAIFDSVLAEDIVNVLNEDSKKSKLTFFMEE